MSDAGFEISYFPWRDARNSPPHQVRWTALHASDYNSTTGKALSAVYGCRSGRFEFNHCETSEQQLVFKFNNQSMFKICCDSEDNCNEKVKIITPAPVTVPPKTTSYGGESSVIYLFTAILREQAGHTSWRMNQFDAFTLTQPWHLQPSFAYGVDR